MILLIAFAGGLNIGGAINSFIKGRYFAFGVNLLLALWFAVMLVKFEFTL
jgi:hypothetical protein